MEPILVSGIQPTGKLHIGNYLGMLKNAVHLQNSGKYQCYFFVADLHSLTEDFNPKDKPAQVKDAVLDMLAAGINPKKSVVFVQSAVPAHSELAWILNTITPITELFRMTQFKNKMGISDIKSVIAKNMSDADALKIRQEIEELQLDFTNVGLFDYPVLMAADIILYDARFVPVGDDQLQHLEFTRTIARKFNHRFGKTFIEPQPILSEAPRVMSLDEPRKKMSKSRPAGCLFIDDSPDIIRKKIMSAVTDSGSEVKTDVEGKEGIGNLVLLYSALSGEAVSAIEKKYAGQGYGQFKRALSEIAVKTLAPFQVRKKKLAGQPALLRKALEAGNKKANAVASKKLGEVKRKIGLGS